jgi:ascorbate-specific PTS system EIIC-type component UlaA
LDLEATEQRTKIKLTICGAVLCFMLIFLGAGGIWSSMESLKRQNEWNDRIKKAYPTSHPVISNESMSKNYQIMTWGYISAFLGIFLFLLLLLDYFRNPKPIKT